VVGVGRIVVPITTDVSRAFVIPSPTVATGDSSMSFDMTYKGGQPPGTYAVSVAVQGAVTQSATFTMQ
jgi:hypothetical protein